MQAVLHPDKFTNRSEDEKKISEEYSSLINKGYNTLQGPLSRALHMLWLKNEVIEESNKSDDPEFLMEVMELNEELEEADGEEKLRKIEAKNKEMLNNVSIMISKCFEENDVEQAKKAIIKMKYYDSLSKRIHDLLREKGILD
ncbi:iron-sulfur cluster co-chaperone protein HscB-like [Onthophagus taurus]|uniref:iron-sulfur cluster co-chaperone protein HscB-like n=1 Tax=Onthophagus taurus TaxID=166361 RepID=UPI000C209AF4|nr:iron-sulfur cluster co-chaperone protein HscB, mitochondrial-like [Onthophagus taurus]XP_022908335.1 iron-sulfur cluster co-chaperone protein HscB, mitochondrial-like isoform X2 [Onthophagus taurus]